MFNETSIKFNGDFDSTVQGRLLLQSFFKAIAIDTRLPDVIRDMTGMSGIKYRYLINNLISSMSDPRYLEIGSWTGSTACSALYGNSLKALCIDNWSEFFEPNVRVAFFQNIEAIKSTADIDFRFIESDFRKVDYSGIGKFNVFLFDASHAEEDQYDGLCLTMSAMEDQFILVIDDWNWDKVRYGTLRAIQKCKILINCCIEIRTTQDNSTPCNCDQNSDWHNGYLMAACSKLK